MATISHVKHFLYAKGFFFTLALAFVAQYLFTGNIISHTQDTNTWDWLPRYSAGTFFLVLASILGIVAAKTIPLAETMIPTVSSQAISWRSWLLGAAAISYVLSLVHYLLQGEDVLTRSSWLASVIFFLGATFSVPNIRSLAWRESVFVLIVIVLGSWLRLWRPDEIPAQIENDVALMGAVARQLVETGDYRWIGFSADSEHLRSYDQLHAWSMRLFGNNGVGLVRISALAGIMTIPILYMLGRVSFGSGTASIAILLLTTSYTHIHFSRIMFGPLVTLLACITLLGLISGMQTRKIWSFAFAGIATGFALIQYDSGKVISVIGFTLFLWDVLRVPKHFRRQMLLGWLFYLLGLMFAFGPMLAFIFQDFQSFIGRGNVVAIWTPDVWRHVSSVHNTENPLLIILYQLRATFLSLHLYGDQSPHFALHRPMVSPITAAFFVLGTGICIRHWRDVRYSFGLLWIAFTFILGGVITYDPPYWPHLNIALPAITLLAGLGIYTFWNMITSRQPHYGKLGLGIGLATLLVINGINNWFLYMNYCDTYADLRIRVSRYVTQQSLDYEVIVLGDEFFWDDYTFTFFNPGVAGRNMSPQELYEQPPVADKALLFIVFNQPEAHDFLRQHYLNGFEEERTQRGQRFVAYHVLP